MFHIPLGFQSRVHGELLATIGLIINWLSASRLFMRIFSNGFSLDSGSQVFVLHAFRERGQVVNN